MSNYIKISNHINKYCRMSCDIKNMGGGISVAICIDDNFVLPATVLINSIGMYKDKTDRIKIFIVSENELKQVNKSIMSSEAQRYNLEIAFCTYTFDNSLNLNQYEFHFKYWSMAVFLRLFLASILPDDVCKVIFLDSDVIVKKSLRELWKIDLTDKAIAGVCDAIQYWDDVKKRCTYDVKKYKYVNAGVLLMNLDYFRTHNLEQQFSDYIIRHYGNIKYNDQEIINNLLFDKKILLPATYNVQRRSFMKPKYRGFSEEEDNNILDILKDPTIIHYTEKYKPWLKYCRNPKTSDFLKVKKHSVFKNTPLSTFDNITTIDKIMYFLDMWLHLDYRMRYV